MLATRYASFLSISRNSAISKNKSGLRRHCAKWWWSYLISFLIIAVLIILLTIFVTVPRIAQDKINKAQLAVYSIQITNASPTKCTLGFNSSVATDGTVQAGIDPFEGAMYLEDDPGHTPFAHVTFPKTNAKKFQWVNFTNEINIDDIAAFTRFNTWFINNKTLRATVKGKTRVQPNGLNRKYKVTFKKTLIITGLNLFRGSKVSNAKVDIDAKPPKFNFFADIELPNPSYFTIDIGNATFNNFYNEEKTGEIYIPNVILYPGTNKFKVSGTLDKSKVLGIVSKNPTGMISFHIRGKSVKRDGQEIKYFSDALANSNQLITLNISDIMSNSV